MNPMTEWTAALYYLVDEHTITEAELIKLVNALFGEETELSWLRSFLETVKEPRRIEILGALLDPVDSPANLPAQVWDMLLESEVVRRTLEEEFISSNPWKNYLAELFHSDFTEDDEAELDRLADRLVPVVRWLFDPSAEAQTSLLDWFTPLPEPRKIRVLIALRDYSAPSRLHPKVFETLREYYSRSLMKVWQSSLENLRQWASNRPLFKNNLSAFVFGETRWIYAGDRTDVPAENLWALHEKFTLALRQMFWLRCLDLDGRFLESKSAGGEMEQLLARFVLFYSGELSVVEFCRHLMRSPQFEAELAYTALVIGNNHFRRSGRYPLAEEVIDCFQDEHELLKRVLTSVVDWLCEIKAQTTTRVLEPARFVPPGLGWLIGGSNRFEWLRPLEEDPVLGEKVQYIIPAKKDDEDPEVSDA